MDRELYTLFSFFLPAFLANMAAVPCGRGTAPIDGGRTLWGAPLFGRNKTWWGFFGGSASGFLIGMFWQGITTGVVSVWLTFALAFGALLGDLLGSFFKRRFDRAPGSRVPLLDEFDYLIGATVCAWVVLGAFPSALRVRWDTAIAFIVLLETAHWTVNQLAFRFQLKTVSY